MKRQFILRRENDDVSRIWQNARLMAAQLYREHDVQITVQPYKRNRSLEQNAFYRGPLLTTLAHETGADPASLHEDLLEHCAPKLAFTGLDGSTKTRPLRTSEMKVDEMGEYIERCLALAADLGVMITVAA